MVNQGSNKVLWFAACGISILALSIGSRFLTKKEIVENQLVVPLFEDVSQKTGIADTTESFGAAAANLTDDDFPDLVVSRHGYISLHKNTGQGGFAPPFLLGKGHRDTHGVTCADFNNDSRIDIMVSTGADRGFGQKEKEVYINRDTGFALMENLNPIMADLFGRGRAIIPYDLNKDGRNDFIMANFYQEGRPHRIAIAQPDENDFAEMEGMHLLRHASATSFLPLNLFNDEREYLIVQGNGNDAGKVFLRTSDTSFVDVSREIGLQAHGYIRKVIPLDFDNDGDLDLFQVIGKKESLGTHVKTNRIYFKYTSDKYQQKEVGFQLHRAHAAFQVEVLFGGGFNNYEKLFIGKKRLNPTAFPVWINETTELDGDPSIDPSKDEGCFLWRDMEKRLNFRCVCTQGRFAEAGGSFYFPDGTSSLKLTNIGLKENKVHLVNKLFKNEDGRFQLVDSAGIEGNGYGIDAVAEDFNNDGFTDIYVVNGGDHLFNPPNSLFLNKGDGTFVDAAKEAGMEGPSDGKGNGCVAFDYDQDGDQDVFLFNGAGTWPLSKGPLVMMENKLDKETNSISVDLHGTTSNGQAWGSQLFFYNKGKTAAKQKHPANGCFSTSDLPVHFGLGESPVLDSLRVVWPSGKITVLENIPAGAKLKIKE